MKIKLVNEIPQHYLSSDIACYVPSTKTIYIRKENLTVGVLIHELTHYFIDLLPLPYSTKDKMQIIFDKKWKGMRK
jgi:hypothetical protein